MLMRIEYRHGMVDATGTMRRGAREMASYLSDLVSEMNSADIPAEFVDTPREGKSEVLIDGRDVRDILKGLRIIMPESDEICDDGPKLVTFGRPVLQWDERHIEDIPDILMKNAISKAYSEKNG